MDERPETIRVPHDPERVTRSLATDAATIFVQSASEGGGLTAGAAAVAKVVQVLGGHVGGNDDAPSPLILPPGVEED